MMPFSLTFRKLLRRYFPKLPPEALDRHESLFAYRLQLQHEKNFAAPDVDVKKQSPHRPPNPPPHPIDEIIKRINEESARIWEENGISKTDFDRVHDLWVRRREFALQQRRFTQFPPSRGYLKAWWGYRSAQLRALPVYVKNHRYPTLALGLLVLALLVAFLLTEGCPSDETPERLQKAASSAKANAERQVIAQRLEQYYLRMCIPDSIEQRVQTAVEEALKQPPEGEKWLQTPPDTHEYRLERQLQDLLRDALIVRARGSPSVFQELLTLAREWGAMVDESTANDYWNRWIATVSGFDERTARIWLSADQAYRLCTRYHQSDFRSGEHFGALGLQMLQQARDERLRLDIMQRLITILYQSRGFFDLTYAVAERELSRAAPLKYDLRETGIAYHYANALFFAGNNQRALQEFQKVVQRAVHKKRVPGIHWYQAQGKLGLAMAHGELGNSETAIKICSEIANLPLTYLQELDLHNVRGINFGRLSKYDLAKNEFQAYLELAEQHHDVTSQILALNNLGFMYYRLSDYDQANAQIARALTLLEGANVQDAELKSLILLNMAETLAELAKPEQFQRLMEQANRLVERINVPRRRAHFLGSLGTFSMKLGEYQTAVDYFRRCLAIYEQTGLQLLALEKKIQLTHCLLQLSRLSEAENHIADLHKWARSKQDRQTEIEALGLLAQALYRKGESEQAIRQTNRLLRTVEGISREIRDDELLTIFRQKSYPYLHEAVRYELERGRTDSAFVKLDYLKGRVFKKQLPRSTHLNRIDIDRLAAGMLPQELLLDYFVTEEQMYLFALTREGLSVFQKPFPLRELERKVDEFVALVENTNEILSQPDFKKFEAHYARIASLSESLYEILLGWPELEERLSGVKVVYIVPDNGLYQLPFSCLKKKAKII